MVWRISHAGDRKDKDAPQLSKKYKVDSEEKKSSTADNHSQGVLPHSRGGSHISGELYRYPITRMEPKDMLEMRLRGESSSESQQWAHRSETCVSFMAKGGSAPQGSADLLKKEWPKAELQDASFREYGFGATRDDSLTSNHEPKIENDMKYTDKWWSYPAEGESRERRRDSDRARLHR